MPFVLNSHRKYVRVRGRQSAQQNQFAEQAGTEKTDHIFLPHPEFEERHVGGVNALDLSCYDESNDTSGKKRKVLASAGRDASVRLWDDLRSGRCKKNGVVRGSPGVGKRRKTRAVDESRFFARRLRWER